MPPLTVSDLRLAFECPRLLYLGYHTGGPTLFAAAGPAKGIGTTFHQLADTCVRQLKQDRQVLSLLEATPLSTAALAQSLQQRLYTTVFYPYLQSALQRDPALAQTLPPLWQGLQGLIQRWASWLVQNRQFCSAAEVVAKTFLAQERAVRHTFTLPNGDRQVITGRCDSLLYDFQTQRLCVIDYKTYQAANPTADVVQVALYGLMLQETLGVPINSAVYSVLPDWQEQIYSWEQLADTLHQLLPAKLMQIQRWLAWQPAQLDPPPPAAYAPLCDLCPQQATCQRAFAAAVSTADAAPLAPQTGVGPRPSPEPQPASPLARVEADYDEIAAQLVRTLQSFGISVEAQGVAVGPAFIRVRLRPQLGVKVSTILRLTDDLQVQLGLSAPPMIAPQAGFVSVDLPRPDRQVARFEQYIPAQLLPADAPVRIAVGVNLEGQLVEADLADPNTCHFLVGGTTGSGKSEFLRSLLRSLTCRHGPDQLQIVLVDPKRVTFPEFESAPWLQSPIVKDSEGAIALMMQLVADMEQRYQRFEQARCADLSGYRRQSGIALPRLVCIFDEYADFMAEKATRTALEQSIKRLGAMARAAGIHLIIATQRPEARVVTPLIRANLPGRIALRTASDADSALILGSRYGDAVHLLGKGDLLYLQGAKLLRLQSLLAEPPGC